MILKFNGNLYGFDVLKQVAIEIDKTSMERLYISYIYNVGKKYLRQNKEFK